MAYVADQEEDKKASTAPADPSAPNPTAPIYTAGTSSPASSTPAGSPAGSPAAPPTQQAGTGYVNFDRFMAANQGAGQQLAQGIAGGVQQAADAARSAKDQAVGAYNTQVGSQQPVYNPNATIREGVYALDQAPGSTYYGGAAKLEALRRQQEARNQASQKADRTDAAAQETERANGMSPYDPGDPRNTPSMGARGFNPAGPGGQNFLSAVSPADPKRPTTGPYAGYNPNTTISAAQAISLANQQYSGPQSLLNTDDGFDENQFGDLRGLYAKANDAYTQAGTADGQAGLLAQYTGRQTADPFDLALMSGQSGNVFQDLKQRFAGLGSELPQADAATAGTAAAKKAEYATADQSYQSRLDQFLNQEKLKGR